MSSYTLWNRFSIYGRKRRKKAQKDIYSYREFCRIIDRERSRADRDNHGFSVASFEMKRRGENGLSFEYLLRQMIDRGIRSTDEVGWFGDRCIGVVLHNTATEGAWSFANNIINELGDIRYNCSQTPGCKVYTYPRDWRKIDNATNLFNYFP